LERGIDDLVIATRSLLAHHTIMDREASDRRRYHAMTIPLIWQIFTRCLLFGGLGGVLLGGYLAMLTPALLIALNPGSRTEHIIRFTVVVGMLTGACVAFRYRQRLRRHEQPVVGLALIGCGAVIGSGPAAVWGMFAAIIGIVIGLPTGLVLGLVNAIVLAAFTWLAMQSRRLRRRYLSCARRMTVIMTVFLAGPVAITIYAYLQDATYDGPRWGMAVLIGFLGMLAGCLSWWLSAALIDWSIPSASRTARRD
jgi:drug/metabolite transporter (DMT)-like permease